MKIKAERMAELEKFGFKKTLLNSLLMYCEQNAGEIIIDNTTRELRIGIADDDWYIVSDKLLNKFAELVKADMIEE